MPSISAGAPRWARVAVLATFALAAGCDDDEDRCPGSDAGAPPSDAGAEIGEPLAAAKLLIEHNATDEDTGFQLFVDGAEWSRLELVDPSGRPLLRVTPQGALAERGLTEMFFESSEPPNAEVPLQTLLAGFPPGEYRYTATAVEDGSRMRGVATFSHAIPAAPVIVSPAEGAVVDPNALVVEWEAVTETIDGSPVEITGYQLILEDETIEPDPNGFASRMLDVRVAPAVTRLSIPPELLEPGTAYKLEVLAIEASGNQTIASRELTTP